MTGGLLHRDARGDVLAVDRAVIVAVPAATPRTPNVVCGVLLPGPIVAVVVVTVATAVLLEDSANVRSAATAALDVTVAVTVEPAFTVLASWIE